MHWPTVLILRWQRLVRAFKPKSGEPTAATFGFINVILSLMEKERPEYLAVAFDTGRTFRNDTFAGLQSDTRKNAG